MVLNRSKEITLTDYMHYSTWRYYMEEMNKKYRYKYSHENKHEVERVEPLSEIIYKQEEGYIYNVELIEEVV